MTTDGAFHSLAKCMAKSKLLTAVTLALMIAPFFYYAWPKALLIAACVQVGSILFRSLFMVVADSRATEKKIREFIGPPPPEPSLPKATHTSDC